MTKKQNKRRHAGHWRKLMATALISIGISIIPCGLIVHLEIQWPKAQTAAITPR